MKIFFTGSLNVDNAQKKFYKKLIDYLENQKHSVIDLETKKYTHILSDEFVNNNSIEKVHYSWINKAIFESDCSIVECTKDGFTLGHIMSLSIQFNKPVLCLSKKKDYSQLILSNLFYADKYDKNSYQQIIDKFLLNVKEKHLSVRKNIYITPNNVNFLDWLAEKNNTNASEIIRNLIQEKSQEYPGFNF